MEKKLTEHNYGIDLLRIISMVAVIALHVLGHGGILRNASGLNFYIAWIIEVIAMPAVNCFVIISGYVGFRNEKYAPKAKNIVSLWFTVVFYSFGITMLFWFLHPEALGIKDIVYSALPVSTNQYWFFMAYVVLFILSPLLNCFVHNTNKRTALITFVFIGVALSIYPVVFTALQFDFADPFKLLEGYSFVWFAALYLIGAYIRKYQIQNNFTTASLLCYIVGGYLISWFTKSFIGQKFVILGNNMVSYISPTMLITAIALVCAFSKLKPGKIWVKLISFFAPVTFAIYLIHENRHFRHFAISGRFSSVAEMNPLLIVLIVFCVVFVVFVICSLIDKVRIFLFRLLRINCLSEKIVSLGNIVINKIGNKDKPV